MQFKEWQLSIVRDALHKFYLLPDENGEKKTWLSIQNHIQDETSVDVDERNLRNFVTGNRLRNGERKYTKISDDSLQAIIQFLKVHFDNYFGAVPDN